MREPLRRMLCLAICVLNLFCALALISGCALARLVTARNIQDMLSTTNLAQTTVSMVTDDPVLLAAAADPQVEAWAQQFAGAYIAATIRGNPAPELNAQALSQVLNDAIDRLAQQYGLSGLTAGLDAVKADGAEMAALLSAVVAQLGRQMDSMWFGGLSAGAVQLLLAPAFMAGAAVLLCAGYVALWFLAPRDTRLIWLGVPPLLCGGICFLWGKTGGDIAGNTTSLAALWTARLQDSYIIAGCICFMLCAILTGFFAAAHLRRARQHTAENHLATPQL